MSTTFKVLFAGLLVLAAPASCWSAENVPWPLPALLQRAAFAGRRCRALADHLHRAFRMCADDKSYEEAKPLPAGMMRELGETWVDAVYSPSCAIYSLCAGAAASGRESHHVRRQAFYVPRATCGTGCIIYLRI